MMLIISFWLFFLTLFNFCNSSLYPRDSETRDVKLLDGVWNFRTIPLGEAQDVGFTNQWFKHPLKLTGHVIPMPVPASFNDITQIREIRDYVGWVWYDRTFFVPKRWQEQNIFIRLGSVHYNAIVYINGINVVNHTGGHLPFEIVVNDKLNYDGENIITIAVNNTLTSDTIPQGKVTYKNDTKVYPKNFYEVAVNFDFFNYAGIHRSVHLYSVPRTYIEDITVTTDIVNFTGIVNYVVTCKNEFQIKLESSQIIVEAFDKKDNLVARISSGPAGLLKIPNAHLWWPFTMNESSGYQYQLRFVLTENNKIIDVYYLKVGIRKIQITDSNFLINGQKFYFRGFGKHEDANIRGKGLDLPLIIKDFNLIKWIGANSFRTSHYPYSEELMDEADEQGIVVIDECPAVGLDKFDDTLLEKHLKVIRELIERDKNRPSVVLWSIANEPRSNKPEAEAYFKRVADYARSLDSRPVTAAINQEYNDDKMAKSLDVLMINRYYAWYSDTGYPQVIVKHLLNDFDNWRAKYKKPIMISEYGADTVSGMHMDPSFIFSEDYQSEYIMEHHKAFDKLIKQGYFVGELIWNFADFMTNEQITRVIGNKKGIFTRERQPKAAARVLRCRYWRLAGQLKRVASQDVNFYCPVINNLTDI